jgi:hypothetical protein
MLGVMIVTSFLSLWIMNASACSLVLPIVIFISSNFKALIIETPSKLEIPSILLLVIVVIHFTPKRIIRKDFCIFYVGT